MNECIMFTNHVQRGLVFSESPIVLQGKCKKAVLNETPLIKWSLIILKLTHMCWHLLDCFEHWSMHMRPSLSGAARPCHRINFPIPASGNPQWQTWRTRMHAYSSTHHALKGPLQNNGIDALKPHPLSLSGDLSFLSFLPPFQESQSKTSRFSRVCCTQAKRNFKGDNLDLRSTRAHLVGRTIAAKQAHISRIQRPTCTQLRSEWLPCASNAMARLADIVLDCTPCEFNAHPCSAQQLRPKNATRIQTARAVLPQYAPRHGFSLPYARSAWMLKKYSSSLVL